MSELKRGSIIQANENAGNWCGCVLVVDKVNRFGHTVRYAVYRLEVA